MNLEIEYGLTLVPLNDVVTLDAWVLPRVGVWHTAHPMELNSDLPCEIEVAPPGTVVDGIGGASRRMNIENATTSLGI